MGNIALSDFTIKPENGDKFPLTLIYCENCHLLQLANDPPRDKIYHNYWYRSGLNPVIVKDLQEIAKLCKGNTLSIGENDGSLLRNVKSAVRVSVDPSNIPPFTYMNDGIQWNKNYWEDYKSDYQFHTIVAIACLYDLPDPNAFMRKVTDYLDKDGTFIAQLMTLQPMIDNNDLGNICHEHIEYYSYKSLLELFERNGLEIYGVETNTINGGSYRIFARHYRKGSIDFKEKEYTIHDLKNFFKRVEKNKDDFRKWFMAADNKNICGYGASTKATTITQYYGFKPHFTVDINPDKIGKFMVNGSYVVKDIPKETQYLWVFPYAFIDYFKKKEKHYKGKWVTTIPEFRIL